jgi:hypothetical protein
MNNYYARIAQKKDGDRWLNVRLSSPSPVPKWWMDGFFLTRDNQMCPGPAFIAFCNAISKYDITTFGTWKPGANSVNPTPGNTFGVGAAEYKFWVHSMKSSRIMFMEYLPQGPNKGFENLEDRLSIALILTDVSKLRSMENGGGSALATGPGAIFGQGPVTWESILQDDFLRN